MFMTLPHYKCWQFYRSYALWPMGKPMWVKGTNAHDVAQLQVWAIPLKKYIQPFQIYVFWMTIWDIWILAPWVNALGSNRLPWASPYGWNGQMNKLCSTTSWNNSIELQMEKIHHGVSKMYFGQGKAHMGQIGKWPEWCITKGLDNSIELWMVLIYPAV